jgi:putative transposase
METAFCAEPLEDALAPHGRPQIFNTDQGAPFTGMGVQRPLTIDDIATYF